MTVSNTDLAAARCGLVRRTHSLISVEDSPQWHARVSRILQEKGVNNVRYRFVLDRT